MLKRKIKKWGDKRVKIRIFKSKIIVCLYVDGNDIVDEKGWNLSLLGKRRYCF